MHTTKAIKVEISKIKIKITNKMSEENKVEATPEEVVEQKPKKQKSANSMPRYSISFTQKNLEQLKAIEDELGLTSISETVRACIHVMYSKTFPNYTRDNRVGALKADSKPVEQISKTEKRQRQAEQDKANRIATAIGICENELGGVVATDENDNPIMCAYFQYDGRRRYKQEIDIMSVTPELVNTQYLPNKERVMQLQKDGNVDYNPSETIEEVVGAE